PKKYASQPLFTELNCFFCIIAALNFYLSNLSNIFAVLLVLIPALLNIGLLFYLVFFLPKGKASQILGLVILAMLFWQIDNLIARLATDIEVMRFWDQILAIGWVCIGAFLIHFSLRFVRL